MQATIGTLRTKLSHSRDDFKVATLKDGTVFALGGRDSLFNETTHRSTEIFDRSTNSWSAGPSMRCARFSFACTTVANKIYVFGGLVQEYFMCEDPLDYTYSGIIGYNLETSIVETSEFYDRETDEWKMIQQGSICKRQGHAAVAIGDDIYLMGGYNGETLGLVEKLNTQSGTLEVLPRMKVKRHDCAAIALKNKIYVFGGCLENSAEVYDPSVRTWTMLPPMQHKQLSCEAFAVGSCIVVIGGKDQSPEVYNTLENTWSLLSGVTDVANWCHCAKIGNDILLIDREGTTKLLKVTASSPTTTPPTKLACSQKLLYMDAANFTGTFFKLNKPWSLINAQKEVKKFCCAARASGWTLVVFLDQAIMTAEAIKKWRTRREREVRKGERNVPQGALRLVGDMFARFGVDVRYSLEADNDDTLASHAQHDNACILSRDKDFLRYRNATYTLFKEYQVRKGKLMLIRQDATNNSSPRDLQNLPLTGHCNPFRDCMEDKNYIRGSPSPLVQLGNIHIHVRPLRAALYAYLEIESVEEEFPIRDGKKCTWDKQVVQSDETYAELLLSPMDAVNAFAHLRPANASDQDWHKHQFALRSVVAEICCTVSGSTLLETLELLLADIKTPPPPSQRKKKKKTHYVNWRESQKTGETNKEKRKRYLKLFPQNK